VAVSVPAETGTDATPAANTKAADDTKKPETRVAAIGDSDFAANGFLGIPGNRDLFMNTANWLVQQENLISIRPVEAGDRRVALTARQITFTRWMIVVLPAAVLIAGFVIRRRRK
jgi:gliding motility-associatede transport system auxiliary component